MDIIISDNWLRDYLQTKAAPQPIAKYVSLCGPSVEKVNQVDNDYLYHVEITTNRIDSVSVYGFAREVAAILPRFGMAAKLKPLSPNRNFKQVDNLPFTILSDDKLVNRTIGVVLTNIKNWQTPGWMSKRLTSCGIRSLNAVVDITNFVMLEVGHPSHAFDYDKIKNNKFIIRESKKGEKVTSFDGKTHELHGGDIVFDDGKGEIIDLPGIIGTKNSVVDKNTKRVFFFIDNNDPARIRKTSMGLAIRTVAASINEKGVDPELGETAIYRGIELFRQICGAEVASKVFDNYPKPYKKKKIILDKSFIDENLGVIIAKEEIETYLTPLGFECSWQKDKKLFVGIPSFRANDMNIPEDVVEEIARIYGYHNIPSELMKGSLPNPLHKTVFPIESLIKQTLKALGGTEVYTLSLVPKEYVGDNALKLLNPLGKDTEYLRTSLKPSLIHAANQNKSVNDIFHQFEMANVYLSGKDDLPEERMTLGGIFYGYSYRQSKGIIENLLSELNVNAEFVPEDSQGFRPSRRINIKSAKTILGEFGILENDDFIYYGLDTKRLIDAYNPHPSFKSIPKYPPQIEDLTLVLPERTKVGNVVQTIKVTDQNINKVELTDIFKNAYTFRINYQNPKKTLTNDEVEKIREKILKNVKLKFGALQKL